MFAVALENGINCLDLYSPDPAAHRRIGRAIARVRKQFYLQAHFCTEWKNEQYEAVRDLPHVRDAFERMLQNLGTDYIDIGNIHFVDSMDTWRQILDNGVMDYVQEQNKQGIIRAVSLSSHNPIVALEAVKSGCLDALLFSINPCCVNCQGEIEDLSKIIVKFPHFCNEAKRKL